MPSPLSISNSKPRNPLAAVWIFAAVVILVEVTLTFLPNNALVRALHSQAVPDGSPDLQIMGDSVARGGILATQLMTTLPHGDLVVNLAIRGTGPEFPYFQLQREITAGRPPKAIIYAPSPHTFATKRTPLLVGAYCTWPEVAEVAAAHIDPLEVLYGVLCKVSYTLRYRDDIAMFIKNFGTRITIPALPQVTSRSASRPHYTPDSLNATYKRAFEVDPFNEHFLKKFLQLAADHHIPVYWATPPVLPAVYESRKKYNFEPAYFGYLSKLETGLHIYPLQKNFLVWDERYFADSSHLTIEGAQRYTALLAEEIKHLPEETKPVER